MFRKGDTLVEVTIAIGIFSMVAIAIVAVMSGGISSTQTALETTIAREEIDAQAEALRFIQSSFLSGDTSEDAPYAALWGRIIDNAIELGGTDADTNILQYTPATCNEAYANTDVMSKAFIINTRALTGLQKSNIDSAYISASSGKLVATNTYPRLIYTTNQLYNNDNLIDNTIRVSLYRAEGIYVIAVKDPGSTQIVDTNAPTATSAYYDFYIRTCWYGAGADYPSTISTVVRLYDPPSVIDRDSINTDRWTILYNANGGTGGVVSYQYLYRDSNTYATNNLDTTGRFLWWSTNKNDDQEQQNGTIYRAGQLIPFPTSTSSYRVTTLYASWKKTFVYYDANGGTGAPSRGYCNSETNCKGFKISSVVPTRQGCVFKGWAYNKNSRVADLMPGDTIDLGLEDIRLYAVWEYVYSITYYDTNGVTPIKSERLTTFSPTHTFTIDGTLNPTAPPVSQNGNSMILFGWSENKDGSTTLYNTTGENGALTSLTATAVTHAEIKLYPIWREIVTFTNVPWNDFGNSSYCTINKTSSGITLRGHHRQAVNCGVEFGIGKDDTFELSANLNTSGIFTHPEGLVAVSIGPLVAIITNSGSGLAIYYGYLPLSNSVTSADIYSASNYTRLAQTNITNNGTVTLKMTKYGGNYTMSVNGYEVGIKISENSNGTYNVLKANGTVLASNLNSNQLNGLKVKYTMIHTSHNCSAIFNATLYNIRMTKSDVYYN